VKPFLEEHGAATGLLVATLLGGLVAEWAVTARERMETELGDTAGSSRARVAAQALVEVATTRTPGKAEQDRRTKTILVLGMLAGLLLAVLAAQRFPGLTLPGDGWVWVVLGLALCAAGLALRVWAVASLGRFFRRDVVVQEGHAVVEDGPYRRIRHPAYAGNLLVALGVGIALANWLSIAALVVVPLLGHLPRIRVEEHALESELGEPYRRYEARTARLVPGIW
jgi:protein-S-isoprenylcysteine O-methyltransferase Ste14